MRDSNSRICVFDDGLRQSQTRQALALLVTLFISESARKELAGVLQDIAAVFLDQRSSSSHVPHSFIFIRYDTLQTESRAAFA